MPPVSFAIVLISICFFRGCHFKLRFGLIVWMLPKTLMEYAGDYLSRFIRLYWFSEMPWSQLQNCADIVTGCRDSRWDSRRFSSDRNWFACLTLIFCGSIQTLNNYYWKILMRFLDWRAWIFRQESRTEIDYIIMWRYSWDLFCESHGIGYKLD